MDTARTMETATTVKTTPYYRLRLSEGATARGERVVCQWLHWVGPADRLAYVRITHSTLPRYPRGRAGVVRREQLIAVSSRHAA